MDFDKIDRNYGRRLKSAVDVRLAQNRLRCRTTNRLMSEMTKGRFRHMPVVESDRLVGIVSIGDAVKIEIAEIEMEAAATRQYTA